MVNRHLVAALIASLALALSIAAAEEPDEIVVFAAASLTGAFGEMGELYENQTGIEVSFNFDSSGALRTQMENGAYADVFASANMLQMNSFKGTGLMNNSSIVLFARNKIALIVPASNLANITRLADLARPRVKIVTGTKEIPVGDYALQILDKLGNDTAYGPEYKEKVLANIISQETSVNYVVAKVALGEADAGFAYVSDITEKMSDKVYRVDIPDEYNVIAEYPMGILLESRYPEESQGFIDVVLSDRGRAILEIYGFTPVGSAL